MAVPWSSLGVVVAVGAAAVLNGLGGPTSATTQPTASAATGKQILTAYVVEKYRNRVTPIVVATRTKGTPIPVGRGPAGIAITPGARFAFVTDSGDGTVTPITLATKTAGTPIPVGGTPAGIAIAPDGETAYVATGAAVVPITVATRTAGIPIPVPRFAAGIAITPDGRTAFVVSDYPAYAVFPIDLATRQRGPAIPGPIHPFGPITITPDGRTSYVVATDSLDNDSEDALTPIDVATRTAGAPIPVGFFDEAIATGPSGRTVFVAELEAVDFVDVATNTRLDKYVNGLWVAANAGIAITPDGATGFVSDNLEDGAPQVIPFSTRTTLREAAILRVGPGPIAITPAQAPVAALTVNVARHGSPSHLDASGSVARSGRIVSYFWYFGDGTKATTTVPTIDHVYAAAGSYTAKVKVADSNHTSTLRVFTGQTLSRNGGRSAQTSRPVTVG